MLIPAAKLFPLLSENPIIFDVGSNKGEWSDTFLKSTFHFFEPNEIKAITIDTYCQKNNIKFIDFLKIDVEGVEYEVLKGCQSMLSEGQIKFLQVKCSETFNDVIDYVEKFGYIVFGYDGQGYVRQNDRLENFIITREQIQNTQSWNQTFINNTQSLGKFDFVLEIGAFEGMTSKYICENLINDGGRMIAIDPLEDNYIVENINDYANELNSEFPYFKSQHSRFLINTQNLPIELIRSTFSESFDKLTNFQFDFIYIDADHRAESVYFDGINAFKYLKIGGYILFDDYEWANGETKRGIDKFIAENESVIEVVFINEQALIRKK